VNGDIEEGKEVFRAPRIIDDAPTEEINLKTATDARNVLPAIALERPKLIKRLKAAMAEEVVRV
jgi:hypothetical protein